MATIACLALAANLGAYDLRWGADRRLIFNSEPLSFRVAKVSLVSNGFYIITFTNGVWYGDSHGRFHRLKTPISPVFSRPRQIENIHHHGDRLYLLTRNRLLTATEEKYTYRDTSGIRKGSRLSAFCIHREIAYIGTTYNGVYKKERGKWVSLSKGLPREKYAWNEYFYDEVKELFSHKDNLYALLDYSQAVYRWAGEGWEKVTGAGSVREVHRDAHGTLWTVNSKDACVFLDQTEIKIDLSPKKEIRIWNGSFLHLSVLPKVYPYKKRHLTLHENIVSIYINLDYITYAQMDTVANMLEQGEINGLVINFKDDTGNLIYRSALDTAKKCRASFLHPKFKRFLKQIEPYDPYLIARVVVFKDYRMHKWQNYRYALKDGKTGKPWRINEKEYWVDPFSDFVVEYNLSVARELEERKEEWGLDEIQFDYIRFPSDRELSQVRFTHRKKGWERYDILENFLSQAARQIQLPFSVDIYGYNGIYRMGNVIGQDIETISKYAPIVCPMYYPSHFGSVYMSEGKEDREYRILEFGVQRAVALAYRGTLIRPYLQAFSYRVKNYNARYIDNQVQASRLGGSRGHGFWNPTSNYSKLWEFLQVGRKK